MVHKNGNKNWVFRYTFNHRRRDMGLGGFPHVLTLSEARKKAKQCRQMIQDGNDPIEMRLRKKAVSKLTFAKCVDNYIHRHGKRWTPKHTQQWRNTLDSYAIRRIGKIYVNSITTDDILSILEPIWGKKTETAKRLQKRIEVVLDFASALNQCSSRHPARWRGQLDKLLPNPAKIKKVKHHPAMPYPQLPDFFTELANKESTSAKALQFLILTATRTSEVIHASWDEIDWDERTWTIPAKRMKMRKQHRIPLSEQAIRLLKTLKRNPNNPHLFPGRHSAKPMSGMALLQLLRKMGHRREGPRLHCVPHGFRSSFRDWAGEVSSHPSDVAEMALAHTIKNKVEAAYRRGDLFEKRRDLMQDWADYCGLCNAQATESSD